MELDQKDLKILETLKESSKLTVNKIGKRLRLPITTVHNRIKKLEKLGVIKNYTINPDYKKLGKDLLVYVQVSVNYTTPTGEKLHQEDIAKKIKKLTDVEEVNIVAGVTDILIKVRLENMEALNNFIIKKLREIPGVDKTQTIVVMNQI